jgi:GlpG protein
MTIISALRLPLSIDLSGFIGLLQRMNLPHRISEEAGEQVLWVPSEPLAEQVRELYSLYPHGTGEVPLSGPPRTSGFFASLAASRCTALVLLLTLVVAGLTLLGDNLTAVRWLTFNDFRVQGDYLGFFSVEDALAAGQWWRLFTPMLLHFGVLHLAMNAMWYWELGRRIELRQGGWMLLGLTLVFGLVSNVAQYVFGGPAIFGGLSGVLYGLLGHCWLFQMLAPNPVYRLPRGVVAMMLIWLLICLSGLIDLLGFGSIANAAHVGGLGIGCATGILGGLVARLRRR